MKLYILPFITAICIASRSKLDTETFVAEKTREFKTCLTYNIQKYIEHAEKQLSLSPQESCWNTAFPSYSAKNPSNPEMKEINEADDRFPVYETNAALRARLLIISRLILRTLDNSDQQNILFTLKECARRSVIICKKMQIKMPLWMNSIVNLVDLMELGQMILETHRANESLSIEMKIRDKDLEKNSDQNKELARQLKLRQAELERANTNHIEELERKDQEIRSLSTEKNVVDAITRQAKYKNIAIAILVVISLVSIGANIYLVMFSTEEVILDEDFKRAKK